jgi:hypothetical protein
MNNKRKKNICEEAGAFAHCFSVRTQLIFEKNTYSSIGFSRWR